MLARAVVSLVLLSVTLARAQTPSPQVIILDPRQNPTGAFGNAVAFVDGPLAVGAPGAPVFDLPDAGVVQLFTAAGVLTRTLTTATPRAGARFGATLAAANGFLYASAPGDEPIGVGGIGAVYVFDAATGTLLRIVRAPDPDGNIAPVGGVPIAGGVPASLGPFPVAGEFGHALAFAGDDLVVGAPDSIVDDVPAAGAVYIFDREGALVRTFQPFTPLENAHFGAAVAVANGRLLVGVPGAPCLDTEGAGVVQVFDLATSALLQTLCATIAADGAALGTSVGVVGGLVFAGAPGEHMLDGEAAGAVYFFDADTGAFRMIVTPPLPTPGTEFGRVAVATDGGLLVGAEGATVLGVPQAGAAFLVDPATGAVRVTFQPTIPQTGGRFGAALAVTATAVAIGAPAPDPTVGPGRAYIFGTSVMALPARAPLAGGRAATDVPPSPTSCPAGATVASVECRLAMVAPQVDPRLERVIRRALDDARSGDETQGIRRARAFRRAARRVGTVRRALEARAARLGMSPALHGALLGAASAEADLLTLALRR